MSASEPLWSHPSPVVHPPQCLRATKSEESRSLQRNSHMAAPSVSLDPELHFYKKSPPHHWRGDATGFRSPARTGRHGLPGQMMIRSESWDVKHHSFHRASSRDDTRKLKNS